MLTLNETFAAPDADQAWSVVNDLTALVPCVPGARVKSVESAQAVKAEIAVRMGAMGMTFTGPVKIESSDAANRTRRPVRRCLHRHRAADDRPVTMWLKFSRSPVPLIEMIVRLSGAITPITNAVM